MNIIDNEILVRNILPYLTYNELIDIKIVNKRFYKAVNFYDKKYIRYYSHNYLSSCTITQKSILKFLCKYIENKSDGCVNNITISI